MQKPFLIDLDGVLRIGNQPAEDVQFFIDFLIQNKISSCILSNSSLYTSDNIIKFFQENSINIEIPIITAIDAACDFVKNKYSSVAAYTSENVIHLFADILNFEKPEAVVIGDIGDLWNYKLMQTIFDYVKNGSDLIAIHKNKFWNKPEIGIALDSGPFIHAIEYATNTNALIIGKPSKLYFQAALNKINSDINKPFIMLGDDLESDMAGAKNNGAETILILTGKTEKTYPKNYADKVDFEANNLKEVISILEKLY